MVRLAGLGGALVTATALGEPVHVAEGVYHYGVWRCAGCDEGATLQLPVEAKAAAREHADECRAVDGTSPAAELAAIREALSELVAVVQALQAEPRRSRRPRRAGGAR